jgi:myo-inositol-1(or 4)-monophosphatase
VPDADTELLVASLREAGAIAREYFSGVYKVWRKSDGNPVTDADIAIDGFLKERLTGARPGYGWLSEETADDRARLKRARTFVVDPIDGTHGFLKHRPQFTIVAAVVEDGRPVAAGVYNPLTEEMYEATLGLGARKNGKAIHVSALADFTNARFLATRTFLDPAQWATPWPEGITLETRASIAYRMALVAEGAFDALISLSNKADWDLAAGELIIHEAGGRVSTGDGTTLLYNRETPEQASVIGAPPDLHRQLIARLCEHHHSELPD